MQKGTVELLENVTTDTPSAKPFFVFSLLGKLDGDYFIPYVLRCEMKTWCGCSLTVPIKGRPATYKKIVLLEYNDYVLPAVIRRPLTILYNSNTEAVNRALRVSEMQESKCIDKYVDHYDWISKRGKVREFEYDKKRAPSLDVTVRSGVRHVLRTLFNISVVLNEGEIKDNISSDDAMIFNSLAKVNPYKIKLGEEEGIIEELYSKDTKCRSLVKHSLKYKIKTKIFNFYIKVMRLKKKLFKKKNNK